MPVKSLGKNTGKRPKEKHLRLTKPIPSKGIRKKKPLPQKKEGKRPSQTSPDVEEKR